MRYPASEKAEIIQLVEQSHLLAKCTLDKLSIPRATFYRWCDRYRAGGIEALADHRSRSDGVWNRIPDYDNTDNTYWGFATEGYTNCGARVSHIGQASQRVRFMGGRYENLAPGATAGISVHAAAQNTVINAPIFINAGASNISDSGTRTAVTAPYL